MGIEKYVKRTIILTSEDAIILEKFLSQSDFKFLNIKKHKIEVLSKEFEEIYLDILTTALSIHGFNEKYELNRVGRCLNRLISLS
jgi:hypothetical protein